MKPIILITGGSAAAANGTPQWSINRNYAEMIAKADQIAPDGVQNLGRLQASRGQKQHTERPTHL